MIVQCWLYCSVCKLYCCDGSYANCVIHLQSCTAVWAANDNAVPIFVFTLQIILLWWLLRCCCHMLTLSRLIWIFKLIMHDCCGSYENCYAWLLQCTGTRWIHGLLGFKMQQIDGTMQPAGCEEQLGSYVQGTYQKSPLRRNSGLGWEMELSFAMHWIRFSLAPYLR
jgi:hypothetical protein